MSVTILGGFQDGLVKAHGGYCVTGDERFKALLDLGREDRFLEYKQSGSWDSLKVKISRTALGMANLRDGGTIVIGVSQAADGKLLKTGMTPEHLATYDTDDVQAFVNRFADPFVRLELNRRTVDSIDYVEIIVSEFEDIPVLCKADTSDPGGKLRKGAFYVRSTRMPETTEIQSQTELREILELATDKGIRRFLRRLRGVGFSASEHIEAVSKATFEKELGQL